MARYLLLFSRENLNIISKASFGFLSKEKASALALALFFFANTKWSWRESNPRPNKEA
ncbi:MAG: hypothetical protein L7S65_00785 [Schleiferiaceae bacterium]|nr:hypothetical protein [Schleiferiaceae bacterium]